MPADKLAEIRRIAAKSAGKHEHRTMLGDVAGAIERLAETSSDAEALAALLAIAQSDSGPVLDAVLDAAQRFERDFDAALADLARDAAEAA